jgi:hypothetical protein
MKHQYPRLMDAAKRKHIVLGELLAGYEWRSAALSQRASR